jgi:hypothetical protein
MAHSSFGQGWPYCNGSRVTLSRKDGLRLVVHKELAELVSILLDLTELMGYDVKPGQTWGAACRPIAGTQTASNHSWATAVDINSLENPRRRPLTTNLPARVVKLWNDHGFRWGGHYTSSTPDPMHFEFMGTVAQARAITKRIRAYLAKFGKPAPPAPARPVQHPGLPAPRKYPGPARLGMGSPQRPSKVVKVWQQVLRERGYNLNVDGIFGQVTNHLIITWQRNHGLIVDGKAGEATWHSLMFTR